MKLGLLTTLLIAALGWNAWLIFRAPLKAPIPALVKVKAPPVRSLGQRLIGLEDAVLRDQLRDAGLPSHLLAAYFGALIEDRFRDREAAIRGNQPLKYWQTAPKLTIEQRTALLQLKRAKSRLWLEWVGPQPEDMRENDNPLSATKRAAVRLLVADYADAGKDLRILGNRDYFTAAERAQRSTFDQERNRELAELLTPAEMQEYYVRYSEAARNTKANLAGMGASESEFRLVLEAQRVAEESVRATDRPVKEWFDFLNRPDLRDKIEEYVKLRLSPERFADYQRGRDFEYQILSQAALRAGTGLATAREVWDIRRSATEDSIRIGADTSLSDQEKASALQSLTNKTRAAINGHLTPAGAEAYLSSPVANWYSYMVDGWAVRIRSDGMEMHPVTTEAKAKAAQRSSRKR